MLTHHVALIVQTVLAVHIVLVIDTVLAVHAIMYLGKYFKQTFCIPLVHGTTYLFIRPIVYRLLYFACVLSVYIVFFVVNSILPFAAFQPFILCSFVLVTQMVLAFVRRSFAKYYSELEEINVFTFVTVHYV